MRQIPRSNFNGPGWSDWQRRCAEARTYVESAVDRTLAIKNRQTVYKASEPFLRELFGSKCCYCESPFDSGRLEIEHFRPKLRASDADGKFVVRKSPGGEQRHCGYYWLAFSWDNLLPACTNCNQSPHKLDKFPVVENTRAWDPKGVDAEQYQLLNPCVDNPELFLEFDPPSAEQVGMVIPRRPNSPETIRRASLSITIYGLNRSGLVVPRMRELVHIKKSLHSLDDADTAADLRIAIQEIENRLGVREPMSAMWLARTFRSLRAAKERLQAMETAEVSESGS